MSHQAMPIQILTNVILLCVVMCTFHTKAHGAVLASDSTLLGKQPGAFIGLSVQNIEKVAAWYQDTLGFAVYSQGTIPTRSIRYMLLQQSSVLIELLQLPDAQPRPVIAPNAKEAHQIHGFFKSSFVVQDIEAVLQRLQKLNVRLEFGLSKPPNGPYRVFGLRDPEGNLLQVFGK